MVYISFGLPPKRHLEMLASCVESVSEPGTDESDFPAGGPAQVWKAAHGRLLILDALDADTKIVVTNAMLAIHEMYEINKQYHPGG